MIAKLPQPRPCLTGTPRYSVAGLQAATALGWPRVPSRMTAPQLNSFENGLARVENKPNALLGNGFRIANAEYHCSPDHESKAVNLALEQAKLFATGADT